MNIPHLTDQISRPCISANMQGTEPRTPTVEQGVDIE
jgi:hypothetical protein